MHQEEFDSMKFLLNLGDKHSRIDLKTRTCIQIGYRNSNLTSYKQIKPRDLLTLSDKSRQYSLLHSFQRSKMPGWIIIYQIHLWLSLFVFFLF